MAAKSFNAWSCNPNLAPATIWNKLDCNFIDSEKQFIVTVIIPRSDTYVIEGETVTDAYIYLVGRPVAVPSPTPIQSFTQNVTAGNEDLSSLGLSVSGTSIINGYSVTDTGTGTIRHSVYEPDYKFDTYEEFLAALENGDITNPTTTCYFDVYIDGIDKPSIYVNWTMGEDISPVTLQPNVWIGAEDLTPVAEYVTDPNTGLKVPNVGAWNIMKAGDFSYGGSYETTYLSIQQSFLPFLNAVSRLIHWGFDGDPAYVKLYLQMVREGESGLTGIGDLFVVQIDKNGQAAASRVAGSSDTPGFYTVVRLHSGEPDYVPPQDDSGYNWGRNYNGDGDGQYDPDDKPDPTDFTDPAGFDGNNVLTKSYAVSASDLRNIGQKLWSQDYFDVLRIQNNPIENIVSVKHFPFALSGAVEEIKIGDIAFGVNGNKIASVQSYKSLASLKIGSYTFTGKYHNYLDLSPYTACKLFLPYIGFVQLDPAEIYGSEITVFYFVDLVTGQCMARIVLDEQTIDGGKYSIPYMSVFGQMGIDIPLTSSDRVQTELRAASAALTAVGGSAGQIISGNVGGGVVSGLSDALSIAGADYTTQRTSSQTPACASFDCQDVFLMVERPAAEYVDRDAMTGYKHLHGAPCHKYLRLSDKVFKDGHFVQIEKRTDLQIAATSEENRMLEQLLTSGVYI